MWLSGVRESDLVVHASGHADVWKDDRARARRRLVEDERHARQSGRHMCWDELGTVHGLDVDDTRAMRIGEQEHDVWSLAAVVTVVEGRGG